MTQVISLKNQGEKACSALPVKTMNFKLRRMNKGQDLPAHVMPTNCHLLKKTTMDGLAVSFQKGGVF